MTLQRDLRTNKLARSTSSGKDDSQSAKPPLASTKRSNLSKKSTMQKSVQIVKAEDDADLMHLSMYDDKDFKAKQEEYIKERINDQAANQNVSKEPAKKPQAERPAGKDVPKEPRDRSKIK